MVLSSDSTVTFNDQLSCSEVEKLPSCYKKLGEAFYKKCFYDSYHIAVNSFVKVLIKKTSLEGSLEEVRYAQVLLLYKNSKLLNSNRAVVQWYKRPEDALDTGDVIFEDCELIMDNKESASILIEQVVGKFELLFCRESQQPSKELKKMNSRHDMYVCRYKIVLCNGTYELVPQATQNRPVDINQTPDIKQLYDKENNPSIQTEIETIVPLYRLSPNKRKCTVTPIKIVNNSVQKVPRPSIQDAEDDSDTAVSAQKRIRKDRKHANGKVCRNLNISLNDANYVEKKDDLKIKPTNNQQKLKAEKNEAVKSEEEFIYTRSRNKSRNEDLTPLESMQTKLSQFYLQDSPRHSKTPRKSILKTPSTRAVDTPKRNVKMTEIVEEHHFESKRRTPKPIAQQVKTPIKLKHSDSDPEYDPKLAGVTTPSTPKTTRNSARKAQRIRIADLTPEIKMREDKPNMRRSNAQLVKESLHVSAVPKSLPCREQEFNNIKSFIESKILDECGGCMYVSGVPGTGKTATVSEVIRNLQSESKAGRLQKFEYIEINGMKMTEPRQAYVHMYRQLTNKTVAWEQAHSLLERHFSTFSPQRNTTVLLVDELDILCTRRQDVVYNILDWPTKKAARLVVVTIANTMDLPERLLMGKITSRLGLTRLTFQPYSHKQLQEVVMARLADTNMFKSDAVQLVARKVASVSGDCRRALDICRRAVEIAEADNPTNVQVSMKHVQQTFLEMISSSKVQSIKGCSIMEQVFLRAVAAEVTRTGVEETTFLGVYNQFESILMLMGKKVPPPGRAMLISVRLGASKLILAGSSRKDLYQKILLNVSQDDIHYALQAKI